MTEAVPIPPTVSVVIPTIGRPVLAEVVQAVLAQGPVEVVVVADRFEAEVRRVLTRVATDPRVRIVAGAGRGSALARQTGVDAATGDVVLLLDDDVVPDAGLIAGHAARHAEAPGRVVVGFMPVDAAARAAAATATIYDNDYRSEADALEAGAPVLEQLWGGNVSLRRADAARVPQAVAAYPLDCREDHEFGLRAAAAGLVGVFDRQLAAVHFYERRADRFVALAVEQARAGRLIDTLHPDAPPTTDPDARPGGVVGLAVRSATVPGLGPVAVRIITGLVRRFGDGPASRSRVGLLVVGRAMAQADALRR